MPSLVVIEEQIKEKQRGAQYMVPIYGSSLYGSKRPQPEQG